MAILYGIATALSLLSVILVLVLLARSAQTGGEGLAARVETLAAGQERTERTVREEIARNREETGAAAQHLREELTGTVRTMTDSLRAQVTELTLGNDQRMEKIRGTVEERLRLLQEDNAKRLEQMRSTVDEKLHATLEQRLGESFKLVSERLEQVHKGLGEMQALASGVGDLKRILSNVKTRGGWGEVQLGNLLEQILSPEQYAQNVATRKGSADKVEYAIRLPGKDRHDTPVWLPVDAKFPVEDYQRLLQTQEAADPVAAEEAGRQLENSVKTQAKLIREKYLDPPNTTDFALMFLPVEGLYAEVLRRAGLVELLQRQYRVVVTGPTTLAALLNSLQMGFRSLAIEKRSSEVWLLLRAVKTDFGRFRELLEKTQKKLNEAAGSIEDAVTKARTIERKLRDVQELPAAPGEPPAAEALPEAAESKQE